MGASLEAQYGGWNGLAEYVFNRILEGGSYALIIGLVIWAVVALVRNIRAARGSIPELLCITSGVAFWCGLLTFHPY
jgi:hypothetical protein